MLDPDGVKGPGVQILGNVLTKQESWFTPEHEPAQWGSTERTNFQNSGEHVASKSVTGCVLPSVGTRIGGAKVRVDLVVGRCDVELGISPEGIRREEKPILCGLGRLLGVQNRTEKHYNKTKHEFLHGFSRRSLRAWFCSENPHPEIGLIFDGSVDNCLNVALYIPYTTTAEGASAATLLRKTIAGRPSFSK
jgi:hypothetical protein